MAKIEHDQEFYNILNMVYGFDSIPLSACNVNRILVLANRFDLKIVEDRVVNFLLSSSHSISIHQRLLIADQNGINFLKMKLISQYTRQQVKELGESTVWVQLSGETTRAVMMKVCSFDPIETITLLDN
ncbi:hypothetical protein PRIPAC_76411 [Pristionchus pacificus]|uniref:Uncharacterized protein n=1 Tax=Pristionchus pacificus TaxID=54126 RepID=A0A2A6CRP4_PRIPA|nr:hypothetical protein PRIPAC_76411 [Pristionchus pacificus]|eukprot:PDM80875.1 hypothetical protein PRIPAC_35878 [Pristionchus pacificus]